MTQGDGTYLAQFNYARLRHPADHAGTKGFIDGTPVIMKLAERSAGFIWSFETGPGGTMDPPVWGDPLISVNMTVWRNFPNFEFFVYNTLHNAFMKRRQTWFEDETAPYLVMWWVPEGHRPSLDEGLDRLAMLRAEGDSARAFGWDFARRHYG